MSNPFAGVIAKAAAEQTQVHTIVPGRVLLVDGDGLAYYCAGNDETPLHQAIQRIKDKLNEAMLASGSESYSLLLTGRGSDKGGRYAIATVKAYQGQRSGSRRPNNWEGLRSWLEVHDRAVVSYDQEADDLFSQIAYSSDVAPVIYTQDKDMRMVTGAWHLDWQTHAMFYLTTNTFEVVKDDKVYGHKWFWLQMLHGDAADNIPGLPKYINEKGKPALCGPVTAAKLLANVTDNGQAYGVVADLYRGFYGDTWADMLSEQAMLLWIRHVWVEDCFRHILPNNGPYSLCAVCSDQLRKIQEARAINAQAQGQ